MWMEGNEQEERGQKPAATGMTLKMLSEINHCRAIPVLFIHSSLDVYLGCSQIGEIMNRTTLDIHIKVFLWTSFIFVRKHISQFYLASTLNSFVTLTLSKSMYHRL